MSESGLVFVFVIIPIFVLGLCVWGFVKLFRWSSRHQKYKNQTDYETNPRDDVAEPFLGCLGMFVLGLISIALLMWLFFMGSCMLGGGGFS